MMRSLALSSLLLLGTIAAPALSQTAHDRVTVCHVVADGRRVIELEVSASALEAHLAHGDFTPVAGTCAPTVPCGGFASIPCPPGGECFDVPGDDCNPGCGGADCPGLCVTFAPSRCAADGTCPPGLTCIDDPGDTCSPDCGDTNCATVCARVLPGLCGGFAGFPCPAGTTCVDATGDTCHPECGGADCGGQCVTFERVPCTESRDCERGEECFDDPTDACSPDCGDEGCAGWCGTAMRPS